MKLEQLKVELKGMYYDFNRTYREDVAVTIVKTIDNLIAVAEAAKIYFDGDNRQNFEAWATIKEALEELEKE